MPGFQAKTKAKKGEGLSQTLEGELAAYEKVGLFTRAITPRSAYRYRGVLLQYQKALQGKPPTLEASRCFLGRLREDGFKPATLHLYRAALQGFHAWRGERLVFPVKIPHHLPQYYSADLINRILALAQGKPRDQLILRLMSDAGLRRGEVIGLQAHNVDLTGNMIRIRGKGDRDRVVPLTKELAELLKQFCRDKTPDEPIIGVKDKAVYMVVKKYASLAGAPGVRPHDLRHAFATRLVEGNANIRAVQELLGHTDLQTTAVYLGVVPKHLEEAIKLLEASRGEKPEIPSREVRGDVGEAEQEKSEFREAVAEMTIEPDKGKYFNISLPANVVWIDSIVVRPSDAGATFRFMVFDREQQSEYPSEEDAVLEQSSTGRRITYHPPRPEAYHDRDESNRLHCGIAVIGRHHRFNLDEQQLQTYLECPVSFIVAVRYRLPQ